MERAEYPISDATMARLLATLLEYEPRAVGVDFFRDVLIPPGSEQLEALIQSDSRVVMIHTLADGDQPAVPPPRVLRGSGQTGLADQLLDADDLMRRALLYADDEAGNTQLSLALQVALRWLAVEGRGFGADPDRPEWIRLGDTTLPRIAADSGGYASIDPHGYQILIDYDGQEPFRSVSVGDVLSRRVGQEDFRDKMVFVGAVAESIADLRRSPFGYWPGVFIHAHIAAQLARYGLGEDAPRRSWSEAAEVAWICLWCLLGAGLASVRGSLAGFALTMGGGVVASAGAGYAALMAGVWIPVAAPLVGWLVTSGIVTAHISRREAADRKVMMHLFSRHVSRTVASNIWEHRDQFLEGGRPRPQRQRVTVFFVDVKSFTPIAEGLDPIELMDWVNDLMGLLASEAEAHGGFVDDFFGDGMKADFGVPMPREAEDEYCADAVAAVNCALSIREKLAGLNESWLERGQPTGRLRIGIDSGFAVVGEVGSSDRMKYTVLGDTANTAARLESLADDGHDFEARRVRILVSHRTHELLGEHFETFDHGEVALKGKAQKIRAIEILEPNPVPD
jgi:adenylate cyclase